MPRLSGGGAQRVMALLAAGLSREKYEIHVGLVTAGEDAQVVLPPWVTVHTMRARRVRWGAAALLRLVWRSRPKLILAGTAEVNFLALLLRPFFPPQTAVVVRQNGSMPAAMHSGAVLRTTRWLYRLLYLRADRVISQSSSIAEELVRELFLCPEQIAVLPNPVDLGEIRAAMEAPAARHDRGTRLLAIGRLSHEKGFDLLLRALAQVRKRFDDVELTIAGTGREETALRLLCQDLHLESAVHFAGYVDCPYALFPMTDLFVLSSRHEAMPNALLEAAAAGLPIVATPASTGIVDLLRDQPGAWLAANESAEALTETLIAALDSIRGGERVRYRFFPSMANVQGGLSRGSAVSAGREEKVLESAARNTLVL